MYVYVVQNITIVVYDGQNQIQNQNFYIRIITDSENNNARFNYPATSNTTARIECKVLLADVWSIVYIIL